jgi:hypothetical protein
LRCGPGGCAVFVPARFDPNACQCGHATRYHRARAARGQDRASRLVSSGNHYHSRSNSPHRDSSGGRGGSIIGSSHGGSSSGGRDSSLSFQQPLLHLGVGVSGILGGSWGSISHRSERRGLPRLLGAVAEDAGAASHEFRDGARAEDERSASVDAAHIHAGWSASQETKGRERADEVPQYDALPLPILTYTYCPLNF